MHLDWLFLPIDISRPHNVGFYVSWHARFMMAAWIVLFPTGIIVARFFKIWPRQDWPKELDNTTWWKIHRWSQYSGAILVLIALYLIWGTADGSASGYSHRLFGWTAIVLCAYQILSGLFRGSKGGPTSLHEDGSLKGDHYDMSVHRVIFEYTHKFGGYLALLSAWVSIYFGLWTANAPNWMFIVTVIWMTFLTWFYLHLQSKGMAIDTYQAIWGNDPELPGNKIKPIGFGIRRKLN